MGGRLVLQAWNVERNLVRKIARVGQERRDRLTLIVERFPKLEAELQIADLDAPTGRDMERRTSREAFRERFQLMLARELPIGEFRKSAPKPISKRASRRSYTRRLLRKVRCGIAVMAAPLDSLDPRRGHSCHRP